MRVGNIMLADGRPAVNASVRVYPIDHIPESQLIRKGVPLSWDKADYMGLQSYLLYRNIAGSLTPAYEPFAKTIDTFYVDGLARANLGHVIECNVLLE